MCGIAGFFAPGSPADAGALAALERATDALAHRGPDGRGVWADAPRGVGLGHRRLSILDLTATGSQPMESRSGDSVIVFNGEIYNHVEMRERLVSRGVGFRGGSDTEVILAAYEESGLDFVRELRGMFALAIWDRKRAQLVLVRDRVGKKPLYYAACGGAVFFASEIDALLELRPGAGASMDDDALDEYLAHGVILGEKTIYRHVRRLPPATCAVFDGSDVPRTDRYWSLEWGQKRDVGFDEAVEESERLIADSVRLRLRADVEVGVLLSGGIDSGIITALAARQSSSPVSTFSIGFETASHDERELARSVAERYGTRHHEILIEDRVDEFLPEIVRSYGEPFGDDSAVPSWFVARYASRHTKVVLNGDGGDELFCGYRRHRAARSISTIRRVLPGLSRPGVAELLLRVLPSPRRRRTSYTFFHRLVRAMAVEGEKRSLVLSSDGFDASERSRLYGDGRREDLVDRFFPPHLDRLRDLDGLEGLLAADLEVSLPDDLLVKMDIACMAHGLEARSPLLDQELVTWAVSIPGSTKLRGVGTKPILREIARGLLPSAVSSAPKRGFELPLVDWLDGDLRQMRDDVLLARSGIIADRFDRGYLESLVSGSERERIEPGRWARLVWSLLVLSIWDDERSKVRKREPARA